MSHRGPSGASLLEVVVALLLSCAILVLSLRLFARQRSVQQALSHRMASLEVGRIGRHTLRSELTTGWRGEGTELFPPDSIQVRAARGVLRVCAMPDPLHVLATAEGIRLPDPSKDSVVFLIASGGWVVRGVAAVDFASADGCGGRTGRTVRLTLSDSIAPDLLLGQFFERGSYHLHDGALRYRRGMAGRQPLTPSILTEAGTEFWGHEGAVGATLSLDQPGLEPWTVTAFRW